MSGLNSTAPLNRLVALLQGLSGIQQVYVGVPESIGPQVVAYIALGGQQYAELSPGLRRRTAHYFVGFAYAVAGAEATAETTMASLIDAFGIALMAERRTNLAGTADALDWDFSLGNSPVYAPVAGQEFRLFPVLVSVVQQQSY